MGRLRWLGLGAGLGLWLLILAPALALVPAAVLDRGPRGMVRPTLFPFALVAFDPFVWSCARNSLAVAALVALGSLVLGNLLARSFVGQRFWGRPVLAALAVAPLTIPPMFGAFGLRILLGTAIVPGAPGGLGPWWAWLGWAWVGLSSGVPLVALASASALERVESGWIDAARLAGARSSRIRRQLVWPVIRPNVARAVGTVFTLTLAEPGAPVLLGLRRTLGYQMLEAALGDDPFPRAAVLALEALGFAVVGRVLIGWWGGAPPESVSRALSSRGDTTRWPRAVACIAAFAAWSALAWLPVLPVIALGLARSTWFPGGTAASTIATQAPWTHEPATWRLAANSLLLGLAVVATALAVARTLAAIVGGQRWRVRSLATWPERFPPVTLGVGALALPCLLRFAAGWSDAAGSWPALARALLAGADSVDPYRMPGLLLVVAVAAVRLPLLAQAVSADRDASRRLAFEAAIQFGASPRAARQVSSTSRLGAPGGLLFLTLTLAATNLTPALLLAPTIESRTATPGVLVLAEGPGLARSQAAAIATCVIVANLLSLAVAVRGQSGTVLARSLERNG